MTHLFCGSGWYSLKTKITRSCFYVTSKKNSHCLIAKMKNGKTKRCFCDQNVVRRGSLYHLSEQNPAFKEWFLFLIFRWQKIYCILIHISSSSLCCKRVCLIFIFQACKRCLKWGLTVPNVWSRPQNTSCRSLLGKYRATQIKNGIVWCFFAGYFWGSWKIILHYSPPRMMTAKMMTAIAMIVW